MANVGLLCALIVESFSEIISGGALHDVNFDIMLTLTVSTEHILRPISFFFLRIDLKNSLCKALVKFILAKAFCELCNC